MKDNPNLDLLRSIAVGFVVWSHLGGQVFHGKGPFLAFLGELGVAVFFVHTCLVLMLSLARDSATGPFLVRRFFRIYPLSVATVLFFVFLDGLSGDPIDKAAILPNLLLIQNFTGHVSHPGPLWSLPYEVQMYLVLPAIFWLTRGKWPRLAAALLWAASVGLFFAAPAPLRPHLEFVPFFLSGVLAFAFVGTVRQRLHPGVLFALVGLGALGLPWLIATFGLSSAPLKWGFCLAVGLCIPLCREIRCAWLARVAKLVATYSYSIYLLHIACIGMAFGWMGWTPALMQWAVFALLMWCLPLVGYSYIEVRGIALGKRLAARLTARGSAQPVPVR